MKCTVQIDKTISHTWLSHTGGQFDFVSLYKFVDIYGGSRNSRNYTQPRKSDRNSFKADHYNNGAPLPYLDDFLSSKDKQSEL